MQWLADSSNIDYYWTSNRTVLILTSLVGRVSSAIKSSRSLYSDHSSHIRASSNGKDNACNVVGERRSKKSVSYTHLRAHETPEHLVCRLLLEKKKKTT